MSEIVERVHMKRHRSAFILEHRKNIGWQRALWELIDNSLDASASVVRIEIQSGKRVTVSDDGVGVEDLSHMISKGGRADHEETESGMYGEGAKAAALYFWGKYRVTTRRGGWEQELEIDWPQLDTTGAGYEDEAGWDAPKRPTDKPNGTVIEFIDIERSAPDYAALHKYISEQFFPALESGKQIFCTSKGGALTEIKPSIRPKISKRVELGGEIRGMKWYGFAGFTSGPNPNPGFTLTKAHRIVKFSFNDSCGAYDASKLYGEIHLADRGWTLGTFKDDLPDGEERDALVEQIREQCEALLSECDKAAATLDLVDLSEDLSQRLFGTSFVRFRNKTDNPGLDGKKPKQTGRKRTDHPKDQAGQNETGNPNRGGKVQICRMAGNCKLVKVESRRINESGKNKGRLYVVSVNVGRPDGDAVMKSRDKGPLMVLVVSSLAHFIATSSGEKCTRQRLLQDISNESSHEQYIDILGKWFPLIASTPKA